MKNLDLAQNLYRSMLLIREIEELICREYHTDAIKSPVHLSIGQEAVASGICMALESNDIVSNTYRCHATYIAKGGNINQMMAELYGKKHGCAGGKAGSMHLIDMQNGIMGASAVVGTTIPVAAGYAFALKNYNEKNNTNNIVVAFFGDGATEEGCFSETINFAALHNLPIIFVCENNGYAIHSPIENRWPTFKLLERIETYGIKTHSVTSGNVFEIYETTKLLTEYVRTEKKPVFFEVSTYRYKEHVGPADDLGEVYRDQNEYLKWKQKDQIELLHKSLPQVITDQIKNEVNTIIQNAKLFAEQDSFPSQEDLYANVYA